MTYKRSECFSVLFKLHCVFVWAFSLSVCTQRARIASKPYTKLDSFKYIHVRQQEERRLFTTNVSLIKTVYSSRLCCSIKHAVSPGDRITYAVSFATISFVILIYLLLIFIKIQWIKISKQIHKRAIFKIPYYTCANDYHPLLADRVVSYTAKS